MVPTAVQEIPVEVVIEQPPQPPKPKPPEEKPKPQPQPEFEKPAYDAPAAPTKEKVNRGIPRQDDRGRGRARGPSPAEPGRSAESGITGAEPSRPTSRKMRPRRPRTILPLRLRANCRRTATPSRRTTPPRCWPPRRLLRRRTRPPSGRRSRQLRNFRNKFARSVEESPVAGGNAESRYLTIVYGKIKAHLHESQDLRLDLANRHGIVDFYVDEGGNLIGRKLVASSGSPNLDIAVMTAITEAAPYPAPPHWNPIPPELQLRPGPKGGRRSLIADVVHSDLLEIGGVIAPVVGGPHSIFSAFPVRDGVELGTAGKRVAMRRVGIIDERNIAVARAAAQRRKHSNQQDKAHSSPTHREPTAVPKKPDFLHGRLCPPAARRASLAWAVAFSLIPSGVRRHLCYTSLVRKRGR